MCVHTQCYYEFCVSASKVENYANFAGNHARTRDEKIVCALKSAYLMYILLNFDDTTCSLLT